LRTKSLGIFLEEDCASDELGVQGVDHYCFEADSPFIPGKDFIDFANSWKFSYSICKYRELRIGRDMKSK
jgi:hypothetical protein